MDFKNDVALIGVFDLIHEGHLNLIEKASMFGNLYVGVVCDKTVRKQKGNNRPFFSENHRLHIIKNLKGVRQAFIVKDFDIKLVLDAVKNANVLSSINVVVRGEDQLHVKGFDDLIKNYKGITVITLNRTPDISSTELIKKFEGTK